MAHIGLAWPLGIGLRRRAPPGRPPVPEPVGSFSGDLGRSATSGAALGEGAVSSHGAPALVRETTRSGLTPPWR